MAVVANFCAGGDSCVNCVRQVNMQEVFFVKVI
jgi:hypothetical protein